MIVTEKFLTHEGLSDAAVGAHHKGWTEIIEKLARTKEVRNGKA